MLLYALNGCTYEDRAHFLYEMRKDVREEFRDVRMNTNVAKYLWEWIARAVEELDTGVYIDVPAGGKVAKTKKRKTRDTGDERATKKRGRKSSTK